MWYHSFFLFLAALVTACTALFSPFQQNVREKLKQVYVDNIPEKLGQSMRLQLQKLLGSESADRSLFRVHITLKKEKNQIALQEGLVSRYGLITICDVAVYEGAKLLGKTEMRITSSFGSLDQPFAVVAQEEMIQEQNIDRLAERIVLYIASLFLNKEKLASK